MFSEWKHAFFSNRKRPLGRGGKAEITKLNLTFVDICNVSYQIYAINEKNEWLAPKNTFFEEKSKSYRNNAE